MRKREKEGGMRNGRMEGGEGGREEDERGEE